MIPTYDWMPPENIFAWYSLSLGISNDEGRFYYSLFGKHVAGRRTLQNYGTLTKEDLLKCNKTVYAGQSENMREFEMGLGNPATSGIYKIPDKLTTALQFVYITVRGFEWQQHYLESNVHSLSSAGFLHQWQSLLAWRANQSYFSNLRRYPSKGPRVVSLYSSNIVTVFIVWAILIFISTVASIYEIRYIAISGIKKLWVELLEVWRMVIKVKIFNRSKVKVSIKRRS